MRECACKAQKKGYGVLLAFLVFSPVSGPGTYEKQQVGGKALCT
jgi:hypothetical protein